MVGSSRGFSGFVSVGIVFSLSRCPKDRRQIRKHAACGSRHEHPDQGDVAAVEKCLPTVVRDGIHVRCIDYTLAEFVGEKVLVRPVRVRVAVERAPFLRTCELRPLGTVETEL